jgi:ATP-binding cassette, subfamily C (CFTR/MRP), member 1
VYCQADIALLDDPLAAVDAHVGKHLFQKCIIEQLLLPRYPGAPKKSVILVTNALQYLNHPMVDKIVVLQDGRIWEQGTYAQLSNTPDSLFSQYLDVMNESGVMTSSTVGDVIVTSMSSNSLLSLDREIDDEVVVNNNSTINNNTNNSRLRKVAIQSLKINEALLDATTEGRNETKLYAQGNNIKKQVGELMTSESKERVVGKVSAQIYLSWSKAAGGIWIPVIILIVFAMVECVNVSSKWWLTYCK